MADRTSLRLPGPPTPFDQTHAVEDFRCGIPSLDEWLRRRALANQYTGATRTFVALNGSRAVCGYYALANGVVSHGLSPGAVRRNMPNPLPVIILARMAVANSLQGHGLGAALLQDAFRRCVHVAEHTGVRALLVHAKHEKARAFYAHHGFVDSPVQPMTLMLNLRLGKSATL